MDDGEHDPCWAAGFRVAASVPDGLGSLKGEEECSHEAVHPREALLHGLAVVHFLVVVLEIVEGDGGENEVDEEDRRPHEDETEPAHLEDLVHTCVARRKSLSAGVDTDDTDNSDGTGAEDEDTYGRSAKGPSTCAGRTR